MNRLAILAALLVIATPALAQLPPIQGVAGPTTSTQLKSIITDAAGPATGPLVFADWCDVKQKGAVGDGVTDDHTAIQACITQMAALGTGGTIYFPTSNNPYCNKASALTHLANQPINFVGASRNVTISACGADITVLSLGVNRDRVSSLSIYGKGVNNDAGSFGAANPALLVGAGCLECRFDDVLVWGGSIPLRVSSVDAVFTNVNASFGYGSAIVLIGSASGGSVIGNWFVRDKFDQAYPNPSFNPPAAPITVSAWQAGHAYSSGDLATTAGFVIQAMNAATSSGGAAPTLKNYGITIVESSGSLTWQLVGPTTYYSVQIDTNANENQFMFVDMSGSFSSPMGMVSTLGGGTAPQTTVVMGSTISQGRTNGVLLNAGSGMSITSSRVGAGLVSGKGIVTAGAWVENLKVMGVDVLAAGSVTGIELGAGANTQIVGGSVFGATGSCIDVLAGVSVFTISGVNTGTSAGSGACTKAITVETGASDYYNIVNNIVHGSGTGVTDNGTGTHKTLSGNN